MVFDAIEWRGRQLEIDPSLVLEPTLDEESGQLYTVIDQDLGIDVFATSREQLVEELAEQLLFAWDAYARSPGESHLHGQKTSRRTLESNQGEGPCHATGKTLRRPWRRRASCGPRETIIISSTTLGKV